MLDTPTSDNIEDFRSRYRGTYGFLVREGKTDLLVYIKETSGGHVTFQNVDGNEYYANLDQNVMFRFLPIIRGWHNTRVGPRYFMRIPERQFHRGISRGNTAIYSLSANGLFQHTSIELKLLEDVFVKKPQSSFAGYASFDENYHIPNKYFLLTETAIYMYDRKIGTIEDRKTILLTEPVFKQEVQDFITRGALKLKVVDHE